jgi:fibronectin-binding autotransporter adhesin
MKPSRKNPLLSALHCFSTAAMVISFIGSARAVDQTYQDANPLNTWNTTDANWDAGVTWIDNNNAIFSGTGEPVTVGTVVADAITFDSTNYALGSGTITLGAATTPITANASATINSVLAFGANTLSTAGAGTLTLGGANTGTGPINVTAGTLKLGNAGALGTSSLVTVSPGATLDTSGFASARPITISGTGVSGNALFNSVAATGSSLSGGVTLAANASIGNAALITGNTGGIVAPTITLGGNTLTLNSGRLDTTNLTAGDIIISSGAAVILRNGTDSTGTLTINAGGVMAVRDYNNTSQTNTHSITLNGGTIGNALAVEGNGGGATGQTLKNAIFVDAGGGTLTGSNTAFGSTFANYAFNFSGSFSGSGALALTGSRGIILRGDTSGYSGTATNSTTLSFNAGVANQTFNGILAGAGSITQNGTGVLTLAGANTNTGTTTVASGTLVLAGANTGNSAVTVASGATLRLDYDTQDNSKLHDSAVLTLSGSTVNLSSATGSHTEVVGSTTLSANTVNTITRTGGNSAVLALNTITRGAGATLNFGASGIATTDNLNNANGILGTWATIGGTDFAVNSTNSPDGLITALSSYDLTSVALDTSANYTDRHMSVDSSQSPDAAITPLTLNYKTAGAYTLTLTGTNTIKGGGILVTPEVGDNASTLTGGFLQAGTAGGDLGIFQSNTANTLTIGSVIQNNTSASTLTKSGAGILVLSGANTFTGAANIAGGTLRFGAANALATTGVIMSAGTLDLAGFNPSILGLRSDGATASIVTNSAAGTGTNTLSITGGWFGTYSGAIQNGATAKTGLIVSGTNARFSLSGTSTFTGGLTINGAGNTNGADSGVILGISSDAALGATANVVTLNNGGTLFNSNSTTAGWTTGTTPTLAAGRSIVLGSGVGGVLRVYGNTVFTVNSVISGSGALSKTDGGILALGGTNTYTGVTTVSVGTIRLDSIQALGSFITGRPVTQVLVASGGAVDLNARGATYGYTIAGTGVGGTGALVNTGAAIGNGSAQTSNIKLSANATIGGANNWALLTNSYNPTSLDLSGFTLTKAGANTIALVSTTTTAGAISVSAGTLAFGVTNGGTGVVGAASSLSLANTAGVSLSLVRDSSIGSLAGGGTTGGSVALGSSTLTIGALNANTNLSGAVGGTGAIVKNRLGHPDILGSEHLLRRDHREWRDTGAGLCVSEQHQALRHRGPGLRTRQHYRFTRRWIAHRNRRLHHAFRRCLRQHLAIRHLGAGDEYHHPKCGCHGELHLLRHRYHGYSQRCQRHYPLGDRG